MKWWRVRLSRQKSERLEEEARVLIAIHGIRARETVLLKARALGKSSLKEAPRLVRLAGCIAELEKHQVRTGGALRQESPRYSGASVAARKSQSADLAG